MEGGENGSVKDDSRVSSMELRMWPAGQREGDAIN